MLEGAVAEKAAALIGRLQAYLGERLGTPEVRSSVQVKSSRPDKS